MRFECVTVCVNYADFLAATLPHNKNVFDRMVVVSDTKDKETHQVCSHYDIECFQTDSFYVDGASFNKGAAINEALKHIDFKDWCLHIDSDVVMPTFSWNMLRTIPLDKDVIYGCDRMMVEGYDEWSNFLASPVGQKHPGSIWPIPFKSGYRYTFENRYLPIGYFQLFNRNAQAFVQYQDFYPLSSGDAAGSDVTFAARWEPHNRQLIEEGFVYHLESEKNCEIGENWSGRKTKRFAPETK